MQARDTLNEWKNIVEDFASHLEENLLARDINVCQVKSFNKHLIFKTTLFLVKITNTQVFSTQRRMLPYLQ